MKKILSIFLVFSVLIQQPAYSIDEAFFSRTKTLLGKMLSKGPKAIIKENLGCFVSLLSFLGIPVIATVGSIEAGIRALVASKEKMAKFKEVWSTWTHRMKKMEKGMKGGGLLVNLESGQEVLHLYGCTILFFLDAVALIGFIALTPAGRRLGRKHYVRDKVRDALFRHMKFSMNNLDAPTTAQEVATRLFNAFDDRKNKWEENNEGFLKNLGLTGPAYDDEKLKIKTFDKDQLNIEFKDIMSNREESLLSLALLPNPNLFPFGKYDERRLLLIKELREKGVQSSPLEGQRIWELNVAIDAIKEVQDQSSLPMDQSALNVIGNKAIENKKALQKAQQR